MLDTDVIVMSSQNHRESARITLPVRGRADGKEGERTRWGCFVENATFNSKRNCSRILKGWTCVPMDVMKP